MSLHTYPYYDPPEPHFYCAECDNYDRCQCDRGYAEYLVAWLADVASGEFDLDTDAATIPCGIAEQVVVEEMTLTGAPA